MNNLSSIEVTVPYLPLEMVEKILCANDENKGKLIYLNHSWHQLAVKTTAPRLATLMITRLNELETTLSTLIPGRHKKRLSKVIQNILEFSKVEDVPSMAELLRRIDDQMKEMLTMGDVNHLKRHGKSELCDQFPSHKFYWEIFLLPNLKTELQKFSERHRVFDIFLFIKDELHVAGYIKEGVASINEFIKDEDERLRFFSEVMTNLCLMSKAIAGWRDLVEKLEIAITEETIHTHLIQQVIKQYSRSGQPDIAIEFARKIRNPSLRWTILNEKISQYLRLETPNNRIGLEKAIQIAKTAVEEELSANQNVCFKPNLRP